MTLKESLTMGRKVLKTAGIENFSIDAWYLLEYVCKIDKNYYFLHEAEKIDEECQKEYENLIIKRSEHIPLQYLTGVQEFMGLEFKVNSKVLIPRQDTEILVTEVEKILTPHMVLLDMCTGSGCIVISLVKRNLDLQGIGVDVSKQALLVAQENAKIHKTDVLFMRSNLFDKLNKEEEKVDVIVSNPPYIPTNVIDTLMPEVRDFEPNIALDGLEDGLYFYKEIVEQSVSYLNENGYLYFEIGHDQGKAVSEMMIQKGYKEVHIVRDLAGFDRVVCGRYY